MANQQMIELTTPGEHLAEILDDLNITPYALAKAMGKSQIMVSRILRGLLSITVPTARLLGLVLDMSPYFWINLQTQYDLDRAKRETPTPKVQPLVKDGQRVAAA